MKNILNKQRIPFLLVFSMTLIITLFTSCNNDDDEGIANANAPVITEIRNYEASPNDTIVDRIVPGQWIVITGMNLKKGTKILIDGVPVDFSPGLFSDTHAVIQVPSAIPFPSVPESQINTITYVTQGGSVVFPFTVVPGQPSITSISNENPAEGDVVMIYGTNLFLINELLFGGTEITDFAAADDGTSISFVMPNSTTSGPLSITTEAGTFSTVFNVNNYTTDVLCNFDNVNTYAWGTGLSSDSAEFPGNQGTFAVFDSTDLAPDDGTWWGGGRSINLNSVQWVPTTDLSLDVSQFALKFEFNVPESDNDGMSIIILKDYNFDGYKLRYQPWKISETKTADFTTEGKWVTITIPLTEFKDASDESPSTLAQLLGESGSGSMLIYTLNEGSEQTSFRAGMDNIRIVQIN